MKNVVKVESNEILENATFYSAPMKNIIKNNILSDYSDGIRRVAVTIIPTNYTSASNYRYGIKTPAYINWNEYGQMIDICEKICFFDKDRNYQFVDKNNNPIFFKVVDRKVRYEGQIFIDLVLQELKY